MSKSYNLTFNFTGKCTLTEDDLKAVQELQAGVEKGDFVDIPRIGRLTGLSEEEFITQVITGSLRKELRDDLIKLLANGGITKISPLSVTVEPKVKADGEGKAA